MDTAEYPLTFECPLGYDRVLLTFPLSPLSAKKNPRNPMRLHRSKQTHRQQPHTRARARASDNHGRTNKHTQKCPQTHAQKHAQEQTNRQAQTHAQANTNKHSNTHTQTHAQTNTSARVPRLRLCQPTLQARCRANRGAHGRKHAHSHGPLPYPRAYSAVLTRPAAVPSSALCGTQLSTHRRPRPCCAPRARRPAPAPTGGGGEYP
jgi:hypothetical protein